MSYLTTPADLAFAELAELPEAEIYVAMILQAKDPETAAVSTFYVTNAAQLYTEPEDDPPSTGFRNVMLKGWELKRRIAERGTFFGRSAVNLSAITLDDSNGDFAGWEDLDWNDEPIQVLAGGRVRSDGTPYPWSLWRVIFDGVTEDLVRNADGDLELILVGRAQRLADNAVTEFYRGFGGAIKATATDSATSPNDFLLALPIQTGGGESFSGLTMEWFGVVDALPAVEGVLMRRGDDYGIHLSAAGELGYLGNGSVVGFGYTVTVGEPLSVGVTLFADRAELYVGRDSRDAELVSTITPPAGSNFPNDSVGLTFGQINGNGFAWTLWEARLWQSERGFDGFVAHASATLAASADELLLVECWKFGDGTGTTALGEKELLDLTLSAGITFVSAVDGDDPEQFEGGSVIGQTKPELYGEARDVEVIPVDSQRHVAQISRSALADLRRLKVRGAPMVPDETITTANAGELTLVGGGSDLVQVAAAFRLQALRLIPRQPEPEVLGQRVELVSTGGHDGIFRVDTVAADGSELHLVAEDGFSAAGLSSASLPAGSILRTADGDAQYTYQLSPVGIVDTPAAPEGQLTADATGLVGSGTVLLASEAFELLVGETPDTTELTFDPPVGFHVAAGARVSVQDVLDALMTSVIGWWIESREGGYRIGNYTLPTGSPRATIAGSPLHELDASQVAAVTGRILSIDPTRGAIPHWQIPLLWGRTWHPQSDGLVGSLPEATRKRLSEPWRTARRSLPEIRRRFPTSKPKEPPIETYLIRREDAERALDLAAPLFGQRLGWWDVQVAGLAMLSLDLYDPVLIQHPHPSYRLTGGKLVRIVTMEENSSSDVVSLEVFGSV